MKKAEKTNNKEVEEKDEVQLEEANQTDISETENQIITTEKERDEWKDKFVRLYSEYENFRKRTSKEKTALITASKADTFEVLLPVLDDFDRALKSIGEASDVNSLKEGVELIYDKMVKSLGVQGLKEMEVKHKEFNGEEHEAITNIPAPNDALKGKVIDVVEKGYILNDKIIRFPKVVVGA